MCKAWNAARAVWFKIREPRVISVLYFFIYFVLFLGGTAALNDPPSTIAGEVGMVAMNLLSTILAFGGALGMVAALPGIWWLERIAVLSVSLSAAIYGYIILSLHVSTPGNRLLQISFIAVTLLMQGVRWHRIKERPYDPSKVPATL